jgi:putative transposase
MPRRARLVLPGVAHHVTQRGNNRQQVFHTDDDRRVYLKRLSEYCGAYKVRALAYCLMPNHVHVVAAPERENGLAKVFGRLQSDYSRYANLKLGGLGHFWQERFYSCPMDDEHTMRALAYIELNPVRAGLATNAWEFAWSSAEAHLRGEDPRGWLDLQPWADRYTPERWKEVLEVGVREEAWRERFREAVRRGLPLGDAEWVRRIGRECGRDLSFRPPGRPGRRGRAAEAAG